MEIIVLLNKIKKIFKKNKLDIRKLEYLTDKLNYGEEGAKLLDDGRAKKKKNKAAKQLTIQIIKRAHRRMILKQLYNNIKPKFLAYGVWILGISLILLFIPIVYNEVFNMPSRRVAGETSDWISFFGSYLGGLFGGLITLIGVRLTISHNNKNQFVQDFPKKDIALRDINIEIKKLIEEVKKSKNQEELFSYLIEFSSKEIELKEKAIIVNPTTYKTIDKLFAFVNDQNRIQLLFIFKQNKGILDILSDYGTIFTKIKNGLFSEYEKYASK